MKLETWLMPSLPRALTAKPSTTNAGSADNIRSSSRYPGSTQMRSQLTQFSFALPQGFVPRLPLFIGSESSRIADHQKYLLGMRWISRSLRKEWWLTALKRARPTTGKTILHRFRILMRHHSRYGSSGHSGRVAKSQYVLRGPTPRFVAEPEIERQVSVATCPQDSRPRIGVASALAARTGSKYSRRNAIFPPTARRNTT
jgi:hypothetical protein